jgi:hypothetical protein
MVRVLFWQVERGVVYMEVHIPDNFGEELAATLDYEEDGPNVATIMLNNFLNIRSDSDPQARPPAELIKRGQNLHGGGGHSCSPSAKPLEPSRPWMDCLIAPHLKEPWRTSVHLGNWITHRERADLGFGWGCMGSASFTGRRLATLASGRKA